MVVEFVVGSGFGLLGIADLLLFNSVDYVILFVVWWLLFLGFIGLWFDLLVVVWERCSWWFGVTCCVVFWVCLIAC